MFSQTLRSLALLALLAVGVLATAPSYAAEPAAPTATADAKVNVNTASVEELALLPHVGTATAQRIVEHREKNGAFKSAEDLLLVRGIGEKSFADLEPYVALSGKTTLAEKVRLPRKSGEPAAK